MDDKSIICNFENLYNAYKRAKAGKRRNESCARFQTMSLDGVHILLEQLKNKTYKMNPYNEFKVYEPKERLIRFYIQDWKASLSRQTMPGRKTKEHCSAWIV